MIEPDPHEETSAEWWSQLDVEDTDSSSPPRWRRSVLILVASITAVALAMVPLYNVLLAHPVADNGLEICGFDYCLVQDEVAAAGLDLVMSRLSNSFLDENRAQSLADELTAYLRVDPVTVRVVGDLSGRIGGFFDPEARSVLIERPARAWTVLHEVAHVVAPGHGAEFRSILIELTRYQAAVGD